MNWFHCHRNGDVARVRVSGEILDGAETLIQQIGDAPKIELRINSPGGNSSATMAIYDALQGKEVSVEIDGRCYSAAVTLAMAGQTIRIRPDAKMMLHRPVNHVIGDSDALRAEANHLDKITARIVAIVATRTRQHEDVVRRWFAAGVDAYFTPDQARDVGLVDEIHAPVERAQRRDKAALLEAKPSAPEFTDAERLLLDFLAALGPLRVADRPRLFRELNAWAAYNITEIGRVL